MTSTKPAATPDPDQPISVLPDGDLWAGLRKAAVTEDLGHSDIALSLDRLRDGGLLSADLVKDPGLSARTLMRVGAVNLSVGRLLEGHVNALRLIDLYGSGRLRTAARALVANCAVFGVWGADSSDAVTIDATQGQLSGSKVFCSGLGTVTHAVVTVNSGPDVQLVLLDVTDPERATVTDWDMLGMKATNSGGYRFSGMVLTDAEWIGAPGDYLSEPDFVGGVWRIAALQAGAAIGLIERAGEVLRETGRLGSEAQIARLTTVLAQAWAGAALVERAAIAGQPHVPAERSVATSIAARLFTETTAQAAISAVEQSLGLRHFASGSETGRMARDLSVYMRQAARDAFLQRAGSFALNHPGEAWGVFR